MRSFKNSKRSYEAWLGDQLNGQLAAAGARAAVLAMRDPLKGDLRVRSLQG